MSVEVRKRNNATWVPNDLPRCNFPVAKTSSNDSVSAQCIVVPLRCSPVLEDFLASNNSKRSSIAPVAWALVLACYLGTEIPCFPCFIDEDTQPYVYSVTIEDNPSIKDLLLSVEDAKRDASCVSEIVLETEAIQELSRSGLFNTAFSVTDTARRDRGPFNPSSYVLHAHLTRLGSSHFLELLYSYPWIHQTQANHVAETFVCALEAILYRAEQGVRSINFFGNLDLWRIFQWNRNVSSPLIDSCAHVEFQKVASARPDAEAICSWEGSLTYSQLDRLSSVVANNLVETGIGPETIVPLCFEKSQWAVVAMLGVWKAGGAYVCLDPSQPEVRRQSIMRAVDARVVVSSMAHAGMFTGSHLRVMIMRPHEVDGGLHLSTPPSVVQTHTAAYVFFTSGSTGEPKGVVVEHRSLCTSLRGQGQAMEVKPGSRFLQYAAYTFDPSVGDIFTTLTHGGCVCIPSEAERQNDLARAMERMQVNQACLTPTVVSLIQPSEVPSLKYLALGGEPPSKHNVATWAEVVTLDNVYGPTECTIWSVINQKVKSCEDASNIGRGIGARTWIVDPNDHNNLMPVGAVGELLLEGPVLGREYLKDPEKTKKAFITDPGWVFRFSPESGRRFYKTGDLVKYDSTGALIFQGRKDNQIKLRGQRIELGEIEHNLREVIQPQLNLAAELVTPIDATGNARIAAFICLESDFQGNEDLSIVSESTRQLLHRIVHRLGEKLGLCIPSYMIPSLYLPLKSLPLSTSRKVDRKRLRAIVSRLSTEQIRSFLAANASTYVPPSTPMEKILVKAWADTLSRDLNEISANDNFIRLGGDSFAAMRLVSFARQNNIGLTVSSILRHSTLASLALAAREIRPSEESPIQPFDLLPDESTRRSTLLEAETQCKITQEVIEDILPATPLQEAMFMQSMSGGLTQFAQEVVELSPALDLVAYKAAWDLVVRKMPIIRTRIIIIDKVKVFQVVSKEGIDWLKVGDLREYMATDQQRRTEAGEAMIRLALYEEPTTSRRVFVLSIHHSIFDGVSLELMFDAIYRVYSGQEIESSPNFNKFLEQVISTTQDPATTEYWTTRLAGTKARQFPTLPSPDHHPHARNSTQKLIPFPEDTTQGSSITISTIIRGAWALILAQQTHASDVIFGAFLAGRNVSLPEIDTLAAPTFTNVPIRIHIDPNISVLSYLQRMQDEGIAMIPYEHFGLQNIAKLSDDALKACQFQNLLVVQPMPDTRHVIKDDGGGEAAPFPGTIISGPRVDADAMGAFNPYVLLVECTILGNGVFVRTSFDEDLLGVEALQRILVSFEANLGFLLREGSKRLGDVGGIEFDDEV